MRIIRLALIVAIWLGTTCLANSLASGLSSGNGIQEFSQDFGFQRSPAHTRRLFEFQSVVKDLRVTPRGRTDFSETGNVTVREPFPWEGIYFTCLVPPELPQRWQFTHRAA